MHNIPRTKKEAAIFWTIEIVFTANLSFSMRLVEVHTGRIFATQNSSGRIQFAKLESFDQ